MAARRAAGYGTWVSSLSVRLPLAFLREIGVAPASMPPAPAGEVERLLSAYRQYLVRERGLAESTIYQYEHIARLFLEEREHAGGLQLERLSAADVSGFLARECPKRSVSGARHLVAELRPLLRYLHVMGSIGLPLRWAVPGVADLRDRMLPRGLEPAIVARLLRSCDRRRTLGRRDYAVLLLMVRLGLRAGEVAALRLDDLDWHAGEALIHGKGGREDRLPVPVDVGHALVSYLHRRGRLEASRALFLKVLAAAGPLGVNGVKAVVSEACRRAGVPRIGAHRSGTLPRPRCSGRAHRCRRSRKCCATTSSRRPRSTRASIAGRCVRWRCRGREHGHEPVASSLARLSADPPPARV